MSLLGRRSAGLLVPLAAIRTGREWGVGEYADLPAFAGWARTGGFSIVMTLPLLEPSPGQASPYSSCSFFALDPLYVRVLDVPEIEELGGERMLETSERERLERVRSAPKVMFDEVRALKDGVLRRAHERFALRADAASAPARDLARFEDEHREWLSDYALFRALKHAHPESWRSWPERIRDARPDAIEDARRVHAPEIRYRTWLQWIAFRQHESARAQSKALGISLAGDEPFLVADDSADVWSRQDRFRFDATVGAPPDAFSADGQEWGLPPYRWEKIAEERFELFAQRGKHTSRLYDLVRIDHVVGLYRTYHRPTDKSAHYFWPEDEASQREQGEAVLRALGGAGTEVIAEDLGVIPDFVRESLGRLGIPGYRVLRWEKVHDRKFRDPATWPPLSVATTGTHDTETSMEWWEGLPAWEREAVREIPTLQGLSDERAARWCEDVHAALLETVYASPSRLALVPVQDVLALRDRINTPNTVGPENWSWRMPWTVPAMHDDAIVRGRMSATRRLAQRTTRTTDGG